MFGACSVGQVDGLATDGNSGVDANQAAIQTFKTMIAPLVTRCTGCHGAQQDPNLSSFVALKAKYLTKPGASSLLVTKADATANMHEGIVYFSATDKTTVGNWLDSL
jgi:hypothetical protein